MVTRGAVMPNQLILEAGAVVSMLILLAVVCLMLIFSIKRSQKAHKTCPEIPSTSEEKQGYIWEGLFNKKASRKKGRKLMALLLIAALLVFLAAVDYAAIYKLDVLGSGKANDSENNSSSLTQPRTNLSYEDLGLEDEESQEELNSSEKIVSKALALSGSGAAAVREFFATYRIYIAAGIGILALAIAALVIKERKGRHADSKARKSQRDSLPRKLSRE